MTRPMMDLGLLALSSLREVRAVGPDPQDKRGVQKSAANAADMAPCCGGTREIERRRKRLAAPAQPQQGEEG